MKKIALISYRKWGLDIYKAMIEYKKKDPFFVFDTIITIKDSEFIKEKRKWKKNFYVILPNDNEALLKILTENKIDLALFYGWSWIVKEFVLSASLPLVLHPSPLPRFRGGSPIQNQILAGVKKSKASVFKMSKGIDDGDIYMQLPMSFEGNISDIFKSMTKAGIKITKKFLDDFKADKVIFKPQKNLDRFPALRRRTPDLSEIKLEDLASLKYEYVYNVVRGLTDPYPNAFVKVENRKLFILKIKKVNKLPAKALLIDRNIKEKELKTKKDKYLKLKDGFAKITVLRM